MSTEPSNLAAGKFKKAEVRSKSARYKSYLYVFSLFVAAPLSLSALFNYLIDPYDVFNTPNYLSINHQKTYKLDNGRLFKSADIIRLDNINTLILGSSKALQGIDPEHPALEGFQPSYNLALTGPNTYEVRRYLEHAIANQPNLQKVILGIDFFMFHEGLANQPGFLEERLEKTYLIPSDLLNILFSFKALSDSKDTVINSLSTPPLNDGYGENGFFPARNQRDNKTEWRFGHTIDLYLTNYGNYRLSESYLRDFEKIVELCREHNIELVVFISPAHATQWESTRITGHWSVFEDWKRRMLTVTNLWDFSGYNSVTSEPISNDMVNYSDSNHYQSNVGDLVINRMFGYQLDSVPPDFGVWLTPDNLEEHLASIREQREVWLESHEQELELVKKIQTKISAAEKK